MFPFLASIFFNEDVRIVFGSMVHLKIAIVNVHEGAFVTQHCEESAIFLPMLPVIDNFIAFWSQLVVYFLAIPATHCDIHAI